jgi:hypothetical protein
LTPGRTRGVLFLLLDAFRYDYLDRCPFLRSLAARGLTGRLQEPFGFLPNPALFGGLTVGEFGYSHICHFNPAGSPFRWTRHVAGDPALERVLEQELRHRLDTRTLEHLPPFTRAYASALQIPARFLSLFDFTERDAPWGKDPGYRSVFHILEEHGLRAFVCGWPESHLIRPSDDGALVQRTLAGFDASHRLGFLHLCALDGLGHAYGPGSTQVDAALLETDRLVQRLVEHLDATFDEYALVTIADHGMVRVLDRVDPMSILEGADLVPGRDAAWFVDSTTVRAWVMDERKRTRLVRALESIPGARLLDAQDWERFELIGTHHANAEFIVLADSGVVFSPNFFQGGGRIPLGMHGYAPELPDNQGLFFIYDSARRDRGDAGVVRARQLFPTILDRCEVGTAAAGAVAAPASRARVRTSGFTYSREGEAEDAVSRHFDTIASRIAAADDSYRAIAVGGSFGRGEGVVHHAAGRITPVNDYDVIVAGGTATAEALRLLGDTIARELGADFVDIGCWPHDIGAIAPSQEIFDWQYGHRVLRGDPFALRHLPRMAPQDIPLGDAIKLLGNRACGILLARTLVDRATSDPRIESATAAALDRPFGRGQVVKLLVALADACLIAWQDYHVLSSVKQTRFAGLWRAAGLRHSTACLVDRAFDIKLGRQSADRISLPFTGVRAALRDVMAHLAAVQDEDDGAIVARCLETRADRDTAACQAHEAALLLCLDSSEPGLDAARAIVERWLPTIH